MINVENNKDEIIKTFETLAEAEKYCEKMQKIMTTYIDTDYAFLEFPKID